MFIPADMYPEGGGQIVRARERTRASGAGERSQDHQEQLDPAHTVRRRDLFHQRSDLVAAAAGEERAAPREFQHSSKARELGHDLHQVADEFFAELQHTSAQRDGAPRRQIAHPVVRQVGAGQHEIARLELADEVADDITTTGRHNAVEPDQIRLDLPRLRMSPPPLAPTILPCSYTTRPRAIVVTGHPVTSSPSHGV